MLFNHNSDLHEVKHFQFLLKEFISAVTSEAVLSVELDRLTGSCPPTTPRGPDAGGHLTADDPQRVKFSVGLLD